jgi:RHH-type proline utilization regulon transcriptional repressor/proline dehydrogenase/delta 1-pyrroline-5-carboxylate dehydrogenase
MLYGAMDELRLDNPWYLHSDVGPVIDRAAKQKIDQHCQKMAEQGRLLKQLPVPESGLFVGPTVIKLDGIEQLDEEIFGPVLHIVNFKAEQIDKVVDAINAKGYGLTFGLHTRVDNRVEQIVKRIEVGNIYVNRNQIGAVVGSQPFGGEGLSGTGPKAGGPFYLPRFRYEPAEVIEQTAVNVVGDKAVQDALERCREISTKSILSENLTALVKEINLDPIDFNPVEMIELPGPTGEKNQWSAHPRGLILCLGPGREAALSQMLIALVTGNRAVVVAEGIHTAIEKLNKFRLPVKALEGSIEADSLSLLNGFDAVVSQAGALQLSQYRRALAKRDGVLIPLINELNPQRFLIERHLCIDTTAAGGNASLIAAGS